MKRPKIVIGVFITLILIVLTIVLLACTVFVVRDITVIKIVSSRLLDEDVIIASSKLKKGTSIITLDKHEIKEEIERANPYVEVVSVRREFPSKVIIATTIRTGIMFVKSEDGSSSALIDSSLKVLNIVATEDASATTATVVSGLTFVMPDEGALSAIGHPITFSDPACGDILLDIAALASDYELSGRRFFTFFKQITFDRSSGTVVYIKTNKGVSLVLDTSLTSSVYDQLYYCLYYYSSKDVNIDYTKGYIGFDKDTNAYSWKETIN